MSPIPRLRSSSHLSAVAILTLASALAPAHQAVALNVIPVSDLPIVDQQQPLGDPREPFPPGITFANFFAFADFPAKAQSFRPTYDNIVGAAAFILDVGPNPEIKFDIQVFDSLATGSRPLRTANAKGKVGTWVEATWFADPLPLTPGETYYLVFAETQGFNRFQFAGALGSPTADPYPPGIAYIGIREFTPRGNPDVDRFAYAFQTFAIPEPGPAALLGVGLAALMIRRRLRR